MLPTPWLRGSLLVCVLVHLYASMEVLSCVHLGAGWGGKMPQEAIIRFLPSLFPLNETFFPHRGPEILKLKSQKKKKSFGLLSLSSIPWSSYYRVPSNVLNGGRNLQSCTMHSCSYQPHKAAECLAYGLSELRCERYILDFKDCKRKKKVKYPKSFFMLRLCWNNNIWGILG